jgi:hypothetical protein
MENRDTSSTADVDTPDLIKKKHIRWPVLQIAIGLLEKRTVTYQATEHYTVFQTFVYGRN